MKLLVRSVDRLSSSNSTTDFIVNFKQTVFIPKVNELNTISLVYASIPNTIYNVTSSNNSINWNDGTSALITTIPVGNYSTTSFASVLATAMTASSSGHGNLTISISFSTTSFFYTISAGSNFTLNMSSSTMRTLLGFTSSTFSGSNSYIGTIVPKLYSPEHLEIRITQFPKPNYSSSESNCTFIIPVPVNSGNFVEYTVSENFCQRVQILDSFSSLNVQLYQGNSVADLNNADWQFCLAINE